MFIVIEGGDGVGKSTLIDKIKQANPDWVYTREPAFDEVGESISQIIYNNQLSVESVAYLFAGSRAEHKSRVLIPAIKEGKTIVCDRYVYSSLIYQGVLGGMGVENVFELNKWAFLKPDLVLVLSGNSHKKTCDNWLDKLGQQHIVQDAFKDFAKKYDNFRVLEVDGLNEEEVFERATKIIEEYL